MSTNYDEILSVARHQKGYFALEQVDVSRQSIHHYVRTDRVEHVMRGIYRVNAFPHEEHEDLVVAYLWSEEQGTISHESALALYELSDVLPTKLHLTVPTVWERRSRTVPEQFELHYADLEPGERRWFDVVPVTSPERTLVDVALAGFDPDLFDQALSEAVARHLVDEDFIHKLLHRLLSRLRSTQ